MTTVFSSVLATWASFRDIWDDKRPFSGRGLSVLAVLVNLSDASAPLISVRLATQQDWKTILEGGTAWTFRIDGKNYELSGEALAEAVKAIAEVKQ